MIWCTSYYFCIISKRFICYFFVVIYFIIIIYFNSTIIPQTCWCYRMIAAIFLKIRHGHNNIKTFCIVYKCVFDFLYAWSKWNIILESYFFISSASIMSSCNTYSSTRNNICITQVNLISTLKPNIFVNRILTAWWIIYFNPLSQLWRSWII